MFGRPPKPVYAHRHFDVEKLVAAEYRCLKTPRPKKPLHASILAGCTDEDIEAHRVWWDDLRRVPLELLAEGKV
jgi:hypothetical protein